jgi:translation initiation factor IF-3
VSLSEALEQAQTQGLDLVEIVPQAKPPVCRLLDYPKYKYEQARKEKLAHKKQRAAMTTTHEVKLSMRIAEHDYETKKKHILRFLNGGDRVKVTVMLRGREQAHADMGVDLLTRVASDTAELSVVNQKPSHEGRNIHMLLSPLPAAQRSENHKLVTEPAD